MAESKLRTLSIDFAVQMLNLVKFLKSQHETIVSNQIGRAGTSRVTVPRSACSDWDRKTWGIFPVYEKFYLKGLE